MKIFSLPILKTKSHLFNFAILTLFCSILLVTEIIILTLQFDAGSKEILNTPYTIYGMLYYTGKILRICIVSLGALVIFVILRYKFIQSIIQKNTDNPHRLRYLAIHLVLFAGFYYLSSILFVTIPTNTNLNPLAVNSYGLVWLITGLLCFFCILKVMASHAFWQQLLTDEANIFLASGATGLMAIGLAFLASSIWKSLAKWTFWLAQQLLESVYSTIIYTPETFTLGVNDFSVNISPQCSGYEGMGLISAFLALYLWLFRQQLKFPHVLILFPIGIISMWLLNVLRIVGLVVIGDKLSPAIAVSGFHSSAGWILFVGLSVLLIYTCQQIRYFHASTDKPIAPTKTSDSTNKALSLLVPFVVLLSSILLTNALSGDFDWLYPIKVLAGITVIWLYRQHYRSYKIELNGIALLIGIGVFIIWLALVPVSVDNDNQFAHALFLQSPGIVAGWLIFRIIGACITVPIIEELAFRGYVLTKLINKDITQVASGQFTWLSFLVSSLLFGLLHGDWLAGFLAGMGFAYALYRRGQLFDAVLAHMVTNALLSAYVIYTGHWSLW